MTLPMYENTRLGRKVIFAAGKIPLATIAPQNIYIMYLGDGETSCTVWLASGERRRCSDEARRRLKFARVPQTHQQISAVSGPEFIIL